MEDYKISFKNINWPPPKYVGQKVFQKNNQQIRLVRFDDQFIEKDWCIKGHIGFVLNGEIKIVFNGEIIVFAHVLFLLKGVFETEISEICS